MNSEPSGLVGRGRDDAASSGSTDHDGLTGQIGSPQQFDGDEERVHVGVQHSPVPRDRFGVHTAMVGPEVRSSGMDHSGTPSPTGPESLSALPSVGVRIAAFISILVAGLAGAFIGYSLIELQCEGDCGLPTGLGLLCGALIAAIGMAVVSVLVMRALGEWREFEDRPAAGHAPR